MILIDLFFSSHIGFPNRLIVTSQKNAGVNAGLKWPPDCCPQGDRIIARTVVPMAKPIRARSKKSAWTTCRTGDAGCCSNVANRQVENMYTASSPASIKYSGQWFGILRVAFKCHTERTFRNSLHLGRSVPYSCSMQPFEWAQL